VIYRGHIIAQYKNIDDIADIHGDRRGVRSFWTPYIRAHFIREKQEYEKKLNQGVNTPQLNTERMRRVTIGLKNLFKYEINPMTQKNDAGKR
jgi:hypothetical protein